MSCNDAAMGDGKLRDWRMHLHFTFVKQALLAGIIIYSCRSRDYCQRCTTDQSTY